MPKLIWILTLILFVPIVNAIDEAVTMPDLSEIPADARALVYGETFLGDEWHLFFIFQDDYQVNVGWYNGEAIVVVTRMEFLSSEQAEEFIDNTESQLESVLAGFQPYTIDGRCQDGDIVLYDIDAANNGVDYDVNYYTWLTEPIELWAVSFYFPYNRSDEFEEITVSFQPDLISCADEDED